MVSPNYGIGWYFDTNFTSATAWLSGCIGSIRRAAWLIFFTQSSTILGAFFSFSPYSLIFWADPNLGDGVRFKSEWIADELIIGRQMNSAVSVLPHGNEEENERGDYSWINAFNFLFFRCSTFQPQDVIAPCSVWDLYKARRHMMNI